MKNKKNMKGLISVTFDERTYVHWLPVEEGIYRIL